jgi:5-methylcytosine-specific restriction endonuclease McrA
MPRAHGGKTTFENTVAACHPCNNKKGSKLPKNAPLKLKKKPVRPKIQTFKPRLGRNPSEEWFPYIPKGILNELQVNS